MYVVQINFMKLVLTALFAFVTLTVFATDAKKTVNKKQQLNNELVKKTIVNGNKKIVYNNAEQLNNKENEKAVVTTAEGTVIVYEPIFESRKIVISRN
jgi:ABC-type Fe3+ transport system substrate-binding protein